MAVTAGGTPYVESSDLVASYPATSLALANKVDTKLDNAPTDNAQSGTTYTFVLADARQLVTATSASAKTFTIPPQSSVTWLTGTMIRVVNYGAGALTVNGGVGVTVTNTAATIAQYGAATAIRTGSNAWTLVPFTGGAGNADFSNTATGTYTDGSGINYKYVTFTGSGTLTITMAGYADVLILGGGGSGATGDGGGGGGGGLIVQNVILTAGAKTVTVGAGAAGAGASSIGITGSYSAIDYLVAVGGGGGGRTTAGLNGGSGGGGGGSGVTNQAGGAGITGQGNAGGASGTVAGRGGGGGGAGAAAAQALLDAENPGGVGVASSITGSSVTYGAGGVGDSNTTTNGGANTGNGGSGRNASATTSGAGGSGVVIVRVKV